MKLVAALFAILLAGPAVLPASFGLQASTTHAKVHKVKKHKAVKHHS